MMKYFVSVFLAIASVQYVSALTVNTPVNVVQCQPVLLSWSEGTGPFFPSILPGGQPSAPALKTFNQTDSQQLTWTVDIQANTPITIALKDATGATAFTDIVTIQSSSNSDCLNGSGSANPAPAPGPSGNTAGATSPAAAPAAGATSTTAAGASSGAARPSGSQAAASSTARPNGAIRTSVTYGLAGALAAVGVALL